MFVTYLIIVLEDVEKLKAFNFFDVIGLPFPWCMFYLRILGIKYTMVMVNLYSMTNHRNSHDKTVTFSIYLIWVSIQRLILVSTLSQRVSYYLVITDLNMLNISLNMKIHGNHFSRNVTLLMVVVIGL